METEAQWNLNPLQTALMVSKAVVLAIDISLLAYLSNLLLHWCMLIRICRMFTGNHCEVAVPMYVAKVEMRICITFKSEQAFVWMRACYLLFFLGAYRLGSWRLQTVGDRKLFCSFDVAAFVTWRLPSSPVLNQVIGSDTRRDRISRSDCVQMNAVIANIYT